MLNTIDFLRDASKKITPIEEVFGGMKLNTVICRDCKTVRMVLHAHNNIHMRMHY